MMSMKSVAGPSAWRRSPSIGVMSKVNVSPASLGAFSTTTMSATLALALFRTESVALGGSLAKLSGAASAHSSSRCAVSAWPAARTGRSAKTIAFGDTPWSVSVRPATFAALALSTIRDGTICGCCGEPMVLGVCAATPADRMRNAPSPAIRERMADSVAGQKRRRTARRTIIWRRRRTWPAIDVAAIVGSGPPVRRWIGPAGKSAGVTGATDRGARTGGRLVLAEVGEAARTDAKPDRIDEHRGRPLEIAQASLQHRDVEGELVAGEPRRS